LVDDDVEQLGVLSAVLENAKARVRGATSAEQAIEEIGRRVPDIIVSDINMPGCDGYYFLRRVRTRTPQEGGSTPAIALSGHTRTVDQTRALLAGYQRHLSKPCRPVELVLAIRDVVDSTRGP
jgi:CheY-like chemotaxis protein